MLKTIDLEPSFAIIMNVNFIPQRAFSFYIYSKRTL